MNKKTYSNNFSICFFQKLLEVTVRDNLNLLLNMQTSFVYILHCSDNTYYTGVTENVYKRFDEHQDGKYFGSYTYSRRPVQLVYFNQFTNIEQAIAFEKRVKKWSQAKKLALIEGRYEDLPNLAKKKFTEK